ncbi:MAG: hypothetical protein IJW63_08065 [Lachnospiraceae bacterium]|nr:hypothetical protein [Lachnospiraceae bacterium]
MINVFNLIILICIMIPNIIYALKVQDIKPVRREKEDVDETGEIPQTQKAPEKTSIEEILYADVEEPVLLADDADHSSVVYKDITQKKKRNDVDAAKKKARWKRLNLLIGIMETFSRFACVVLTIVPFGVLEFGFSNKENFIIYVFGNIALIITYWVCWSLFMKKRAFARAVSVSVLSALIFLLTGLTLDHWWLCWAAVLFGACHTGIVVESVWEE